MKERPEWLPDYNRPPIDEVAIAVQFPIIENLTEDDLREFWRDLQEEYPLAQSQPRLEGPIEQEDDTPSAPTMQFSVGFLPQGRLWFVNQNDDILVQVQNTRFIQNWRHRQSDYERFEKIHELFWGNFRKYRQFLERKGFVQPKVLQVEVTYINWLPEGPLARYFKPAAGANVTISGTPSQPIDMNWNARYRVPSSAGLIQRLYLQCQPAIRIKPPHERGSQFALVFRAANPGGISDAEVEDAIYSGRVVIVAAFTELTTEAAHTEWDRFK